MTSHRRVIIESPYASDDDAVVAQNERYARAAMRDALLRGEAPLASHVLYTQKGVLNDRMPDERRLGMIAGFAWGDVADATIVYQDLGTTGGMKAGIERAKKAGRPIEYRVIATWNEPTCPRPEKRPLPRRETLRGYEGPDAPEGPRARPAPAARGAKMPRARGAR